ncbi:MAG: SCO family protein [Chitinophagales bacterium]|nr:SCO family protein [Chitinophagales bacterium]
MRRNKLSFFLFLSFLFFIASCHQETHDTLPYQCPMKCEGEKIYSEKGTCPVCNMDTQPIEEKILQSENEDEILETSIFNLTSKWNTQNKETIELKDLKGDVLVIVMIYTSCKAACPRLVADMRNIYASVNDKTTKYILVSIDPETDTPERLKEFAIENQMDNNQWVFLQGTVEDVREFSNVLAVKYKRISPLDFSHSNIISVFDQQGVLVHQQEGLGVDNEETIAEIMALSKAVQEVN